MTGVTLVLVIFFSWFEQFHQSPFESGFIWIWASQKLSISILSIRLNFQVVLEVSTVCNTQRQKPGKGRWLGLLFTESRKHKVGAKKL